MLSRETAERFLARKVSMKNKVAVLLISVLLLGAGCEYEVPLAEKKDLPIDSALLGLWESGGEKEDKETIAVSRYSDTEYAILFVSDNKETRLRGYPIEVAEISCVQLVTVEEKKENRYYVITYELSKGFLIVRMLNASKDLKSSIELRNAFIKNKDNNELFVQRAIFKKVNTSESK
jgi:hypothetical protein